MSDAADRTLYRQVAALLAPGERRLHGAVVHTEFASAEESLFHAATVEVGDIVTTHATAAETWVYAGNDDSNFGVNQHQGLTLDGDEFVWECQQLYREGTYDLVIYWEATDDLPGVIEDIRRAGYVCVGIAEDGVAVEPTD